jgi:hypothetical protein
MPTNECGREVSPEIASLARQLNCLGGVRYVYQDGDYEGRYPVASLGCHRPTRFGSENYQNFKVALADGWVAFKSPSGNYDGPQPREPAAAAPGRLAPQSLDDTLEEILRLTDPRAYSAGDDPWLDQARERVEQALDRLLREFLELPYLHRVEHSLHARLFSILTAEPEFAKHLPLGRNLGVTQLVHKEWPGKAHRAGRRRGNVDLAVLSPRLLESCPSLQAFREGLPGFPHHLGVIARELPQPAGVSRGPPAGAYRH